MKYQLKQTLSTAVTNPEHLRRVEFLDSIDFTAVCKKAKILAQERGSAISDEYAERGILALKQYYAIAVFDPANGHAVSPAVDLFWHAHMLFSHDYTMHTKEIVGEYMHHAPLDHDNPEQVDQVRRLYDYTMTIFPQVFSRIDRSFWPLNLGDDQLLCKHFGCEIMYMELQPHRIFEPVRELAVTS